MAVRIGVNSVIGRNGVRHGASGLLKYTGCHPRLPGGPSSGERQEMDACSLSRCCVPSLATACLDSSRHGGGTSEFLFHLVTHVSMETPVPGAPPWHRGVLTDGSQAL